MPAIGIDVATTDRIPHLHRLVIAPRGHALAIGRPRHRGHSPGMPVIDIHVATIGSIPDPYGLIIAPRGNALAIGRPRGSPHISRMPTIGVENSPNSGLLRACQPEETTGHATNCQCR